MVILKDFNVVTTIDDILRAEGMDPEIVRTRRPTLVKTASDALEAGFSKIHPAALIHELEVIEHLHDRIFVQGGKVLVSPLIANHFSGAERIVLVVCTIGPQLEEFSSFCLQENPLFGLALDGLGNAAVENISQQVCIRIGEQAQKSGLTASTPFSPGEPEWPVEVGQPFIFSLLDPSKVGITLSSAGMMLPKKSVSFAVGIGLNMTKTSMCNLCSRSERCHYRHA
jgi:hypothetical protein